jgi:uroporphyrinogen decarboxylase
MTSRERVRTALSHHEPDRVPLDLGGSVVTSIGVPAYAALRAQLGLPRREIRILEVVQQIAEVDDDVMDVLHLDVVPVFADPPSGPGAVFTPDGDGGDFFKDDFGATLRRPRDCHYYDWREFPLAEPSIDAMNRMPWPDLADPSRYAGLRSRVKALRGSTDRALFGMAPGGHDQFNQLFRVRGMEEGLMDLVANVEFAEAFLDRLTATIIVGQEHFLNEVGDLIDVHFAADDLAGQSGPLVSPSLWRTLVKPRQARIMAAIKAHTRAPVFYHSCGAVTEFLPDLIEIGVDILNPVQVAAAGMDTRELKRKFGKDLSFWGGGCDTQKVLPYGTPAEVRAEVERRIGDLAPEGGFVFNPVHNIQSGVPAANIVEAYATALREGGYAGAAIHRRMRPG